MRCQGAETGLGIELGEAGGGEFLHELVHAHVAVRREVAKTGALVVWQADGEGAHGFRRPPWGWR